MDVVAQRACQEAHRTVNEERVPEAVHAQTDTLSVAVRAVLLVERIRNERCEYITAQNRRSIYNK